MPEDDEFLDHPDDLFGDEVAPLTDEEGDLFPLFAEALDINAIKTVEEAEAEWRVLFDEGQ